MSFLSNLLQGLSGRRRLFLLALLVALSAVLLTLWTSDDLLTTSVVGGIVVLLFALASPLWRPRDYGRTRVRLYSLAIIAATALPYGFWSASLTAIAQPYLGQLWPILPPHYGTCGRDGLRSYGGADRQLLHARHDHDA